MSRPLHPASPLAQLEAEIVAAAERDPVIAHALQEERAALSVAAAVSEVLESRNMAHEHVAKLAGISLDELDSILSGTTSGATSIATLAKIAAAVGYRFGFNFVPKEVSARDYAQYAAGPENLSRSSTRNY